jgi:NADPH:quinone reductase-like Zn-dependent oxidoreductase
VTNFQVEPDHTGLLALSQLVEQGKLSGKVGAVVPLDNAAEAHRMVERREVSGKVVLSV